MANNKFVTKNGLQTQDIDFVSPNRLNTISIDMLDTDTLSVSGNSGQLFSITDSLTGTIFAVNDISGVPSIEVFDTGKIQLAETFGNVLIGTATDNGTDKLQINGSLLATTVKGNLDWSYIQNKPDPVVTVTLTGDVTGSANTTLTDLASGTVSISTTIASDSVALGTDTTGNYVATIATTSPLSGGAVGSEGTAITLSLADGYGDTKNPYASKTAKTFLAAPNAADGAPTFRAIVASDIPTLNQNTTGTASNVTGTVAIANGGTGATTAAGALTNLGAAAASHTHNLTIGNGTATQITYTSAETLNIVAGTNVSISYDDSTNKVTINSSYTNTDTLQSISDDTSTNATYYPSFVTATSGALAGKVSSSKLTFNPSTGNLLATRLESNVTTGTAPLTVASTTVVSNLNADLLDGNHASAFALSGHTHSYYIGTTAVQTSSADQALTGITSITGGSSNLIVKTADTATVGGFSRNVLIRTGNATGGSGSFAGDILIAPGTSDASAAQTTIKGGESASGNNGAGGGGHLTLEGGANSSAVTSGIISAGNVYLTGGSISNTSTTVTKYTGAVYIDGGGSGSGGTINYGTVNIGGNSGSNLYGTSAVNIGNSSITTTINGTVKLPNVGTSGFVKLGAGGQLSADTNTYLTAEADTLQTVTTRGSTTTTSITAASYKTTNWTIIQNASGDLEFNYA